jgi:DNA-binding MarR family transcriptional regulator
MNREELLVSLNNAMRKSSASGVVFSNAVAERLGIHSRDLECLDLLYLEGPVTAGQLADITGLTTGAVTGLVDRLERAGYVRRIQNPKDRRSVIIEAVPESFARIGPYFASLGDAINEELSQYSEKELRFMLDFFSHVYTIMNKETVKVRKSGEEDRK